MVSWESNTSRPGVGAGGAVPVVGEGDDLAGLFGLGDVGVGVDHLGGGVVLGEEGEHRRGCAGSGWARSASPGGTSSPWWRMAWKSRLNPASPVASPSWRSARTRPGSSGWLDCAADPVGVAGQVGGLGQGGQARGRRPGRGRRPARRRGGPGRGGRTWPAAASRSSARPRAPWWRGSRPRRPASGRPSSAIAGNSSNSPAWSHGSGGLGRASRRQRPGLDRVQPGGRAPLGRSSRRASRGRPSAFRMLHTVCAETGVPSAVKRRGDLGHRAVGGAQRQHPVADRRWPCAGPSGPGLEERKQLRPARTQRWPSGAPWRWSSRTGRRPRPRWRRSTK